MAYNTGNPIGSTDPRDLSDNAQDFDQAVNGPSSTWVDRLGNTRTSLRGQVGYTGTGTGGAIQSYTSGLVLSGYNVIILYSGEFYRPSASATLPYTTTATLPDVDGNLVSIGDANLRQDLANDASGSGAALVSMEGGPSVEAAVLSRTTFLAGVSESFAGLNPETSGAVFAVRGWFEDQEFGGGLFVWLPNEAKSLHDGGVTISPTVPAVSDQAGATSAIRQQNFRDGAGETDPGGTGAFVRLMVTIPSAEMWGAVPGVINGDAADAAEVFVQSNASQASVYPFTGHIVLGTKPLPSATSKRDAFQVSRNIDGLTDCHAFADKTTIENATDAGTYGTFDSETEVGGTHDQSHQFSFQDRAKFSGEGTLGTWGNIIWPVKIGTGTVTQRTDIEIKDVAGTGGSIGSHIGLYMRDLARANSNVAINLQQSDGFSVFAPNAGKWQIGGDIHVKNESNLSFITIPISTAMINGKSKTEHLKEAFLGTNSLGPYFGTPDDGQVQISSNLGNRLIIEDSAGSYAVRPGADNAQKLGTATNRWSEVYASNGTINTSDAREKTDIRQLNASEINAAKEIGKEVGVYRWLDSIAQKGHDARLHIGLTVQRAIEIMTANNLDPMSYGFICYDEWNDLFVEHEEVLQSEDQEAKAAWREQTRVAGNRYGFRYDQLNLFIARGFEARLSALEENA